MIAENRNRDPIQKEFLHKPVIINPVFSTSIFLSVCMYVYESVCMFFQLIWHLVSSSNSPASTALNVGGGRWSQEGLVRLVLLVLGSEL